MLRQTSSPKLRQKQILRYGAAAIALGLIIGAVVFIYLNIGNIEKAKAAADFTSKNNFEGLWSTGTSWVGGVAPPSSNVDSNIEIFGFITLVGDLNYQATGGGKTLTISDTLVIDGNVTMNNKANITVNSGGLLIITGNFTAENKIVIGNGGMIVIGGDMTFNNSNQSDYTPGGDLFVLGTVTGNTAAEGDAQGGTALQNDFPNIFNYVTGQTSSLPVDFKSVKVESLGNNLMITWQTASETNNDFFTIEASDNGKNFETIGNFKGAGNSNQTLSYRFVYQNPKTSHQYYRIKQTDYDGKYDYSKIVSFKNHSENQRIAHSLEIISVGPNPFTQSFTINFEASRDASVVLRLLNQQGIAVASETIEVNKGNNRFEFVDKFNLKPGIYILAIAQDNNVSKPVRVVKK